MGDLRRIWVQGHSLVVSVPKWMATHMHFGPDDYMEMSMVDDTTIMVKLKRPYEISNRLSAKGKPFPKGGNQG